MTAKNEIWLNLPMLGGMQHVTRESNPVAWAYARGSDMGGNLDCAQEAEWDDWQEERNLRKEDWHYDAPRNCWRQRDGTVIGIAKMADSHLGHAIRFAQTKSQHASRLPALLAERKKRLKLA
jgi:hypothetical protein